MIEVEGLSRRFGDRMVVDDVSFAVQRGDVLGFLGPNGAGKTTTMRVLTGYLPATAGRVEVAGHDVLREPLEVKRRIGYLPERPPVYPEMRVDAYLGFVAAIKGVPRKSRPESVERVSGTCGLSDVRRRLIGNLSKGFRQRVGLAAALVHNPEVLILDEPTVGLDPKQIVEIRKLVRSLASSHTVILSTHILAEVTATCNRVIIINEGRIVVSDSLESLRRRGRGPRRLGLRVARASSEIPERLRRVPGVTSVEAGEEEGSFGVTVEADHDPREEIAAVVVGAGWGLLELSGSAASLEQVFLEAISRPAAERPVS